MSDIERMIEGDRIDDVLELAAAEVEADLSDAGDVIGDAIVERFAERPGFMRPALRAATLRGLWAWGVSSCTSANAKRAFLCAVVDEDEIEASTRTEAAIVLSLMGDRESLHALAARLHLDVVPGNMAASALMALDPVEAYEELAPRYREDLRWRSKISKCLTRNADERWIEDVLRVAPSEPQNAIAALRAIATERAREELRHWVDRATSLRDPGVVEALEALEYLREDTAALREELRQRSADRAS